jgi:ligand-binding sensor domain-containing protein
MKQKTSFVTLLVLLISFMAVQPLFSQDAKKMVSHPSYMESVNDLCMVGDQLWLATSGGLVQFNTLTGSFACYNKSNAGLPHNQVNLVSSYADGQIAYSTPKGIGILRDTTTVATLVQSDLTASLNSKYRTKMEFFGGKLFIGSLNRIFIYDQTKWTTLNVLPPYMSSLDLVYDFELGSNGNVYVAKQRGVGEVIGDTLLKTVTTGRLVTELAFTSGAMWMATPNGLFSKKDSLVQLMNLWPSNTTSAKCVNSIFRMKKSAEGKLWLLTRLGLSLYNPADASLSTYPIDTLRIGPNPLMTLDAAGHVWLVGQKPGRIWKFDGTAWTPFSLKKGLASNHVGDFVLNGNHVWIGCKDSTFTNYDGKGSCVYDSAAISRMKHKRPIFIKGKRIVFFADSSIVVDKYDTIRALIKTGYVNKMTKAAFDSVNATYWACTKSGLERIKDSILSTISVKALGAANDMLFGLYLEKSGSLLISSYPYAAKGVAAKGGQLMRYNAGKLEIIYTCPNPFQYVSAVVTDSIGALWMGVMDAKIRGRSFGGGVVCIKGKTIKTYLVNNSGLPSNSVSDISIDKNGTLWFACFDGGLARLTKAGVWCHYTSENSALESDSVEQVAVDANNNIWASTLNGGLTFLAGDPVVNKVVTALKPIESASKNSLEVYPMPCTTEVNLKFSVSVSNARVSVYNLSGQNLMDVSFDVPQDGVLAVPLNALSKGMYLLKVSTAGSTECKRLIVQ